MHSPDPSSDGTPRFGTPTQGHENLKAPDLGTNGIREAARVWQELLGMIDPFQISDIGLISGKLWVGIGKRCHTLYGAGELSMDLYLALIDALTHDRPKLRETIKADARIEQDFSCEMQLSAGRLVRFRVNHHLSCGIPGVVMRPLPSKVPSPDDIGLEMGLVESVMTMRRGIVLLTGTTNSGKSTTIAALLEAFNQRHKYHVVTLEDPIELRFKDKLSVFNQREIGEDSPSFAMGLRAAMRQAPHIIFVGEMRDYETVHTACLAAETGHIVLSTTHTDGVALAASRLVDTAPPGKDRELRKLLSRALKLVIYQTLPRRRIEEGGGRECLREILHVDHTAATMIGDGKDRSLNNHMLGTEELGNQLFARAFGRVESRLDPEDAEVLKTSFAEQLGSSN